MDSGTSRKNRIIVLSCLENEIRDTTIKFASNANEEIYIVARIPLFKSYVRTLLGASAQATIVLVYEEMEILLELLLMIQEVQRAKVGVASGRNQYADQDKRKPSATAEFPLGFNVIILRSEKNDKPNHLTEPEMALQQTLRFISLKHGATYAAISEEDHKNPDDFGLLINNLLDLRDSSQLYVYDRAGLDFTPGTTLHQLIPHNWDSWKKIALLSKSIPRETSGKMLESDDDFSAFNDAYEAYFSQAESSSDDLMCILGDYGLVSAHGSKAETLDPLLSYSDMIAVLEGEH